MRLQIRKLITAACLACTSFTTSGTNSTNLFQSYRVPSGNHQLIRFIHSEIIDQTNPESIDLPDLVLKAQCIVSDEDPIPLMARITGYAGPGIELKISDESGNLIESRESTTFDSLGIVLYGLNEINAIGVDISDYRPDYYYHLVLNEFSVVSLIESQAIQHRIDLLRYQDQLNELDQFLRILPDQTETDNYKSLEWIWLKNLPEQQLNFRLSCYYLSALTELGWLRESLSDEGILNTIVANSRTTVREFLNLNPEQEFEIYFDFTDEYSHPYKIELGEVENEYLKYLYSNNSLCGIKGNICLSDITHKSEPEVFVEVQCSKIGSISLSTSGSIEATIGLLGN